MSAALQQAGPHGAARIVKEPARLHPAPHLLDHDATCERFRWDDAAALLDGLPGGAGLNIAYEAVDRHLAHGRGDRTAIRWIGKSGARRELAMPIWRRPRTASPTCCRAWACRPANGPPLQPER